MINENLEYKHPANSVLNVLVGMLIGGLAGAVTMLLVAPQSGKRKMGPAEYTRHCKLWSLAG